MERLSSGLRINRAGDDAAGLAISEKMRAQVRGLTQASRNAQDGISMIQTAEGALNETHSILQRMRELANQAANDTNVGVDREEIQKELNALTSEINRIGNTTEFNTQKLLNGGGEVTAIDVNEMRAGAAAGAFKGGTTLTPATAVAAEWDLGTVTQTILEDGVTSHSMDFNGVTITVTGLASAAAGTVGTASVDAGANTVSITLGSQGGAATAAQVAEAVAAAFTAYKADAGTTELNNFTMNRTGADLEIVGTLADGDANNNLGVTTTNLAGMATPAAATTSGVTEITEGSSSIPITTEKTSVAAVAAQWALGDLTALNDGESGTLSFGGVTLTISAADDATEGISGVNQTGATVVFDTNGGATSQADQAQLIVDAFNAVKAAQPATGSIANFTFERATNAITITGRTEDGATNNTSKVLQTGDVDLAAVTAGTADELLPTTAGVTEVRGEYSFEIKDAFEKVGVTLNIAGQTFTSVEKDAEASQGQFNIGSNAEEQAISLAAAINGNSSLNGRFDALVDGAKITLREKEGQAIAAAPTNGQVVGPTNDAVQAKVDFSIDESVAVGGRYSIAGVNIEVTDDARHSGLADGTAVLYAKDTTQQATNLANAIAANSALSENYTVESSANRITLEQKEGKESMQEINASTSTNKHENFQSTFQVGANSGQSMTIEVDDMRSLALGISGEKAGARAVANNGVEATFVAIASVSNGTDNTSVEFALDVSDHTKAQAAVSVINDAIETVSAERSRLGAFQNRLEHTISNLGTSSENMQAAESRIRDLDMAQEMMAFTKNNILAQAATAMLAQANMAPQSVLQLLG